MPVLKFHFKRKPLNTIEDQRKVKMQNVAQGSSSDSQKVEKGNAHHDTEKSSPQSSNSSPTKSGTETFSELQPKFMTDSSESEEDDVSEVRKKLLMKSKRLRVASSIGFNELSERHFVPASSHNRLKLMYKRH